jgi:hypothetical protein
MSSTLEALKVFAARPVRSLKVSFLGESGVDGGSFKKIVPVQ